MSTDLRRPHPAARRRRRPAGVRRARRARCSRRAGSGLAGRGRAAGDRLAGRRPGGGRPRPRPRRWRRSRSTTRSGVPGTGPVAFGALPFVPGAPAPTLVVPEVVVGRADDGTRWITTDRRPTPPEPRSPTSCAGGRRPIGPGAAGASRSRPPARPRTGATLVERATKAMAGGRSTRSCWPGRSSSTADRPLDRQAVLDRLRAAYPGCHIVRGRRLRRRQPRAAGVGRRRRRPLPPHGRHRAPERRPRHRRPPGRRRCSPRPRTATSTRSRSTWSTTRCCRWCSYLDYEAEPSVVAVANVQHLATLVEGRLSRPPPSVLELVAALHPTPAVGGWPRERRGRLIAEHRGHRPGPLRRPGRLGRRRRQRRLGRGGPLRRASTAPRPGSSPATASSPTATRATELAETRAKLQAMLSALVRP